MTDAIREKGGEVLIFSSMHETGQRTPLDFSKLRILTVGLELNQLTGIAAILTYPLDIDLVEAEEREAKEEAELAAIEQHG
jgi:protein pelota